MRGKSSSDLLTHRAWGCSYCRVGFAVLASSLLPSPVDAIDDAENDEQGDDSNDDEKSHSQAKGVGFRIGFFRSLKRVVRFQMNSN